MSTSGTLSRRPGTNHSNYSADAAKLDNHLDALLEDLQTSVTPSRSAMGSRNEYYTTSEINTRKSPRRSVSPLRSMSPSSAVTTTVEKYVTTGPAGSASGIPGLEMLDAELQDVQPGQTKTVAYKQVSYHYDKAQEGKDLEPWSTSETLKSTKSSNDSCILDGILERSYDESRSTKNVRDSPDFAKSSSSKLANKEIIYKADVTTKTIPVQPATIETRSSTRDHKIIKETSYRTTPSPITSRKNLSTMRSDKREEVSNMEYIPSSVPANLAPGPNTKVTTTVKTYTYELPGAPETYVNSSTSSLKNLDKSIQYSTYSLPRTTETTKNVSYHHVDEEKKGIREYTTHVIPTTTVHREDKKVYMEERSFGSVPPPSTQSTLESKISRRDEFLQSNGAYVPPGRSVDHVDHATSVNRSEKTYYYEKEPVVIPVTNETTRTTVKQYEEHYSNRPPKPVYPTTETKTVQNTSMYKSSYESSTPKTFTSTVRSPSPQQKPPKRLEDLMASFSETEEVMEVDNRSSRQDTREHTVKKEVEYISKSPTPVKTKNITGPPVYYPPGSAEFTRKEESMAAMSRAGGGWAKERAAWEYGSSSKSTQKEKQKKAVVPVCLPLCCALPCVIM